MVSGGDVPSPGWVIDESLCSLYFIVQISTSDGRAFDDEFAYAADGHKIVVISRVHNPQSTSAPCTDGAGLGNDELMI
jgi:hypothetical protein